MSAPIAPVEVSTRYATTVETLADAWEFVMTRIDLVGADPGITISPFWRVDMTDPDAEAARLFTVVVDGMVEEPIQPG
jgi:hypothetical protein